MFPKLAGHRSPGPTDHTPSPSSLKIPGRNIINFRYADDTTLMAESEEELLLLSHFSRVRLCATP